MFSAQDRPETLEESSEEDTIFTWHTFWYTLSDIWYISDICCMNMFLLGYRFYFIFKMWLWKSYWDCGGPPEAQQGLARSLEISSVGRSTLQPPLGRKVLRSLIRHSRSGHCFMIRRNNLGPFFNKRTVLLWHHWWLPVDFDGCESFFCE